jgi:hypothetical protein
LPFYGDFYRRSSAKLWPDQRRAGLAPVVVFDVPLALLLLCERDVEVEVEVAAERGPPGSSPSAACTLAAARATPAKPPGASRHGRLARI